MDEASHVVETTPTDLEIDTGKDVHTEKHRHFLVILVVLLVIFLGITGWFYFGTKIIPPVNHLIEGVPYYGIYNLVPDFSSLSGAVAMLLRYHGDERHSFSELKKKFPDKRHSVEGYSGFNSAKLFFKGVGYNIFTFNFHQEEYREGEINEIKRFIKDDIPVLILKQDLNSNEVVLGENVLDPLRSWAVIIGVFDDTKTIIIHDRSLGNNYEYSYDEFQQLLENIGAMIAAWPTEELAQILQKPDIVTPYPERLDIMDSSDAEEIIYISGLAKNTASDADALCDSGFQSKEDIAKNYIALHTQSIKYRDEVINHPSFQLMSPLFQFQNKLWKARSLIHIGEVTKGRQLLLDEVIPTNHDLDQSYGFELNTGFYDVGDRSTFKIVDGQSPTVWGILTYSYNLEGNYKAATEAYLNYLEIDPNDERAQKIANRYIQGDFTEPIKGYWCIGGDKELIK